MKTQIRVSLVFTPRACLPLYQHLEELGPYYRASHLRSILTAAYTPDRPSPVVSVGDVPECMGSVDDASADDALSDAFPDLCQAAGGQQ